MFPSEEDEDGETVCSGQREELQGDVANLLFPNEGVWLKIKQEGLRRFGSMFPLARVPFWYRFFEPQPNLIIWLRSFAAGICGTRCIIHLPYGG